MYLYTYLLISVALNVVKLKSFFKDSVRNKNFFLSRFVKIEKTQRVKSWYSFANHAFIYAFNHAFVTIFLLGYSRKYSRKFHFCGQNLLTLNNQR